MAGGTLKRGRTPRRLDSPNKQAQSARFVRQRVHTGAFRPASEGGKRADGAAKGRQTPSHSRSSTVTRGHSKTTADLAT
jgi:hypothetical protein